MAVIYLADRLTGPAIEEDQHQHCWGVVQRRYAAATSPHCNYAAVRIADFGN